jgi:DNA-binding winged helix-turn-helix (wHTH) protein
LPEKSVTTARTTTVVPPAVAIFGSVSVTARERASRDLVVERASGAIVGRGGDARVTGVPVACRLLATLIEAGSGVVGADDLYREVWGGREYHPLRHRNTVYVAINRLRRVLDDLVPGREVVQTVPGGWRIAHDVDACSVRAAPCGAGSSETKADVQTE